MEENKYCVYMHTCLINNKKYIGITNSISHRWGASGKNYKCQYFYRAINKHGWDNFIHEVLVENLKLEEAKSIEIEMIEKYKTTNKKFGYNISSGGDCRNEHTKEAKEKMSLARIGRFKGKDSPRFGIKHSEETREKIKEALKCVDWEPIKEKISESNSIQIIQLSKDGNFIKEWSSITIASENCGISQNTIIRCCKHISKSVQKYIWIYKEEYINLTKEDLDKIIKDMIPINSIKIAQLEKNGNFIKYWDSINLACINLFSNDSSAKVGICACCKGKLKTSFGYKWMYKEEYDNISKTELNNKINLEKINKNSHKILQFNLEGSFIKEFNSTSEIEIELGIKKFNINNACRRNGSKRSFGYIWLKKEDYEKNQDILNEKLDTKRKNERNIVQLNLNGDFIKKWNNVPETMKYGFLDNCIYNCCKQKASHHKGYIWMYYDEYETKTKEQILQIYKNMFALRKIVQLSMDCKLLRIWDSLSQIREEGDFISSKVCDCCNKKRKTHKNFKWLYYDDYKLVDNFVDKDTHDVI